MRNVRTARPWRKEVMTVRGVIEDGTQWTLVQGTERWVAKELMRH